MTLSRKARAGRPLVTQGPMTEDQLRFELQPDVQRLRRLALSVLTNDWRPLNDLRRSLEIHSDPWRDLRDCGRAERRDESGAIHYRLPQPGRRNSTGGK
jgi:hypothetical protein